MLDAIKFVNNPKKATCFTYMGKVVYVATAKDMTYIRVTDDDVYYQKLAVGKQYSLSLKELGRRYVDYLDGVTDTFVTEGY